MAKMYCVLFSLILCESVFSDEVQQANSTDGKSETLVSRGLQPLLHQPIAPPVGVSEVHDLVEKSPFLSTVDRLVSTAGEVAKETIHKVTSHGQGLGGVHPIRPEHQPGLPSASHVFPPRIGGQGHPSGTSHRRCYSHHDCYVYRECCAYDYYTRSHRCIPRLYSSSCHSSPPHQRRCNYSSDCPYGQCCSQITYRSEPVRSPYHQEHHRGLCVSYRSYSGCLDDGGHHHGKPGICPYYRHKRQSYAEEMYDNPEEIGDQTLFSTPLNENYQAGVMAGIIGSGQSQSQFHHPCHSDYECHGHFKCCNTICRQPILRNQPF